MLTERSRAEAKKRRPDLGISETTMANARAGDPCGTGRRARPEPAELVEACAAAGIELDGTQTGHVLRDLTELMAIVFADPRSKADSFALADEWITDRREPEHALGEAVTRFVRGRGPVTRQDIGKWCYLAMGSVDAGLEAAGSALERITLAGTEYLLAAGAADIDDDQVSEALRTPLLLPGFDEYIIGYGSRAPQLDESFFSRIVPGRNGVFKPIVVIDGEIVGTWSRKATTTRVSITVEPFTRISAANMRGLSRVARGYGEFLGLEAVLA
ncbi:winged helix DNA-binding domain-containing protein [Tsukamurella paurometabola]